MQSEVTTTPVTTGQSKAQRLEQQPGELIRRHYKISFTFDGRHYTAYEGDTIASALAAAGVSIFSRSFKYHRPRGLLCCAGHCPNCLVQVGDEPNVRACQRPVESGMQVQHQNAWPSLNNDLMALTQLGDRFLPVGFYYKTFIHPRPLWPVYETVLRQAAGLGKVDPETERTHGSKQFLHTDVVVIGGGPAGISAALAAAEQGAQVLLFDENSTLGGHLRYQPAGREQLAGLRRAVERQFRLRVYLNAPVLGWYQDNWISAMQRGELLKIRAQTVIVATGAYEMPLVFDNNDLPGVMLGSAVQRLLHLYAITPGRRALIVTANDDGWQVAADLQAAGVAIAGIADERTQEACSSPLRGQLSNLPIFWQHTIGKALGKNGVTGALLVSTAVPGKVDPLTAKSVECDLIAVSVGWTPILDFVHQAGGKVAYHESRGELLPVLESLPSTLAVAGRAAGTHNVETQIAEGRLAGVRAALALGLGAAPTEAELAEIAQRKAAEPCRSSTRVLVSGEQKRFVCFCEDVTDKDIKNAIAEGYDSLELLKRYSTLTMGPCQGKMCAMNSIHLCARANQRSVQQTGTTTSRQPFMPVSLATLAGQHIEPAQITPIHEWHKRRGAKMMVAGLWYRPHSYEENIAAEVRAVRERVGIIDVSTLGKLRLTGPGVPTLLNRLYINQWQDLKVGRVRYGVMCNDEAVVLDDGVCARLGENEWYMTTTTSGASAIFEWIQWWLQSGWGEGIHLTDLTESYAAFNLAGAKSRAVLQKLTTLDLSNAAFPYMHVREAEVAGVPSRLLRIGFTGELAYEIHVPSGHALYVWEALMDAGRQFGIGPFGMEAQRVLRLEKGHIIVSQDTDATTDPLSADLGWAVKLDKPDFLGKRSLTRIAAEGPRQKLVGFKMAQPGPVPEEGLQIVRHQSSGKEESIGYVTSCRFSPTLQETIGLCWLPTELAAQNGASFTIRLLNGSGLAEAIVHHGPFYDPKGEKLKI